MTIEKHIEVGRSIYDEIGGLHSMEAVQGTSMAFTKEKDGTFSFSHKPSKTTDKKDINHTKISLNDNGSYDISFIDIQQGLQTIQKEFLDIPLDLINNTLIAEGDLNLKGVKLKTEDIKKTKIKSPRPK